MNGWMVVAVAAPFAIALGCCLGTGLRAVVDRTRDRSASSPGSVTDPESKALQ